MDKSSDNMPPYHEVEDFMYEQCIIPKDFNAEMNRNSFIICLPNRLRVAITIFSEIFTPAVLKIYYIYLKNQQLIVDNLRHHIFPTIIAFIANSISRSLASVQKAIQDNNDIDLDDVDDDDDDGSVSVVPEQSVDCQVLYTPDDNNQHIADIIFIHGLHGGIDRTWKQGRWRHDHHHLKHQQPVRNDLTNNWYLPRKQRSLKRTMTEIYSKVPYKFLRKSENQLCIPMADDCLLIDNQDDNLQNKDENYTDCWPKDWLPKDCPGVRVIAMNYSTDILWCPIWKKKRNRTDMVRRSDEMIAELCRLRVGERPIIWVGHSKGGLFIKQIILNSWEKRDIPEIYDIFNKSRAIMFYSVPHKGSSLADFTLPLLRRSVELIEIQRNCDFVLELHRKFLKICKDGHFNAEIFSFIETSFTLMSFVYLKIVAYESADPDIGVRCAVPLDHREICKPAGRDCFLYLELVRMIKKHVFND